MKVDRLKNLESEVHRQSIDLINAGTSPLEVVNRLSGELNSFETSLIKQNSCENELTLDENSEIIE